MGRPMRRLQGGALMIEILVTIAITVIGLWGLLEVQARLQQSEMEAYQRTQALILLEDMTSRLDTNRLNADDYITKGTSPGYVGVGNACANSPSTIQQQDSAEWCAALQGASEVLNSSSVGSMVGGRGCVEEIGTGTGQYMITVAWQGLVPLTAPPASVTCGANLYDLPAGSNCVSDRCRRYVTTMVRIPDL